MEQAKIPPSAEPTDTLWLWEEDVGGGDGPHSPPPARRMLPARLGFASLPPWGLAVETGKAAQGQPMAENGKEKPKLLQAELSPPRAQGKPGVKNTPASTETTRKKKRKRKAQMPLPPRNAKAGFCVCPKLVLSLWKGLFVKCFVFVSPAFISPRRQPAPRMPLRSQVCQCSPRSIPPSPRGRYPAAPAFHNGCPRA